jgi:hypothetical protein
MTAELDCLPGDHQFRLHVVIIRVHIATFTLAGRSTCPTSGPIPSPSTGSSGRRSRFAASTCTCSSAGPVMVVVLIGGNTKAHTAWRTDAGSDRSSPIHIQVSKVIDVGDTSAALTANIVDEQSSAGAVVLFVALDYDILEVIGESFTRVLESFAVGIHKNNRVFSKWRNNSDTPWLRHLGIRFGNNLDRNFNQELARKGKCRTVTSLMGRALE